jgi:hypothetical protein
MKVYEFSTQIDYFQNLTPVNELDFDQLHRLLDQASADWWRPIKVKVIGDVPEIDYSAPDVVGDFPYLSSGLPCLSRKAVDLLRDLLLPHGKILPLKCDEGEYQVASQELVEIQAWRDRP